MKVVMGAMCFMGTGYGMRVIHSTCPRIALSWIKVLGVLRMVGLIVSTLNGVGSPKIAICPGLTLVNLFVFC